MINLFDPRANDAESVLEQTVFWKNKEFRSQAPALILRWAFLHPRIDLEREIIKMDTWVRENPTRAPRSRIARFIGTWLKRARPGVRDYEAELRRKYEAL